MKAINKSEPFIVAYCEAFVIDKVAKDVASRGKCTKGWFYGFKLQGVCTKDGTLVVDAGYLLKKKDKIQNVLGFVLLPWQDSLNRFILSSLFDINMIQ